MTKREASGVASGRVATFRSLPLSLLLSPGSPAPPPPTQRGFHSARLRRSFDPIARHLIREYLQKEYVNKPTEIFMLLLLYPSCFSSVPIVVIREADKCVCDAHALARSQQVRGIDSQLATISG